MIADVIRLGLQNLPAPLLIIALVAAAVRRRHGPAAERFLSWVLLLPIGVSGLWAGAFHVFFPATAARLIGWDVSPFQFEVGMADLAIGATACIAFWRDLNFKAAVVTVASIFLLGDAVGHIEQMRAASDFAPGNAGVILYRHRLPRPRHRSSGHRQAAKRGLELGVVDAGAAIGPDASCFQVAKTIANGAGKHTSRPRRRAGRVKALLTRPRQGAGVLEKTQAPPCPRLFAGRADLQRGGGAPDAAASARRIAERARRRRRK